MSEVIIRIQLEFVGEGIVATSGTEAGDYMGHGTTCEEALQSLGTKLDHAIAQRGQGTVHAEGPSKALEHAKHKLQQLFPGAAVDHFRHRCGHMQLALYRPDNREGCLIFSASLDCVRCRPHPWGLSDAEKIALSVQETEPDAAH